MFHYLRLLLFPISIVYGVVTFLRNKLFDIGWLKSTTFDLPVICVGNLVVGGAGKTPLTEYLTLLLADYKVAILSRGYGRKTKGFLIANQHDTAHTIGDEPLQYFRKFKHITVAVCEDRVFGINHLKNNHDVIILDDAYQHRYVKAGYNLLLFDFKTLQSPQWLLPSGNLREFFFGYQRANMVVITKTPDHTSAQQKDFCKKKFRKLDTRHIVFSSIKYHHLVSLYENSKIKTAIIDQQTTIFLLTGIANPKPLKSYLASQSDEVLSYSYSDHYVFQEQDMARLSQDFVQHSADKKIIVTTEKDAQRLQDTLFFNLLSELPVFYLPIEIRLSEEDKHTIDQNVLNFVKNFRTQVS